MMAQSLTIVIPTKDRPNFVRACVQAACAGLPANGQVIVVDDKGTLPAAKSLGDMRDPRLKIVVNTGRRGPSAARNFGVSHATGDVILFVDDDDLLTDGYADHVADLANTARYGYCATQSFKSEPPNSAKFQPQTTSLVATLPFKQQLAGLGCGFWIYRSDFIDLGGIDEALTVNEDTDFSIRLLAAGLTGVYEQASGVLIRQHSANLATDNLGQITKRSNARMRAGYFQTILTKNADYLQARPKAEVYIRKRMAKMHAKAGMLKQGLRGCNRTPLLLGYFLINWMIYRIKRR